MTKYHVSEGEVVLAPPAEAPQIRFEYIIRPGGPERFYGVECIVLPRGMKRKVAERKARDRQFLTNYLKKKYVFS